MFQPPVKQAENPAGDKVGAEVAHNNEAGYYEQKPEPIILIDDIPGGICLSKNRDPAIYGGDKPIKKISGNAYRRRYQYALQKVLKYFFPSPRNVKVSVFHIKKLIYSSQQTY